MSMRSRIATTWRGLKAAGEAFAMTFPRSSSWRWLMPRSRFNYKKEVGEGLGSSVIMAPVLWIMRTFPEAPPVLIRDDETIKDHDMLELIRRPNPYYSGHLLSMATVLSFVLNGNGYWLVEPDGNLKPLHLWYVPHTMIKPVWPEDGSVFISHYVYNPLGTSIAIPRENVIHFRYGLDPQNTRLGLSPLATLLREVFTDDEAGNFTAALLHNSGVPGLIVGPDWGKTGAGQAILPEDKQDVKDYMKSATTGDRRGEPLVFSAPTKVEQFGFSPKALDLSQLRRVPEERVTACLGVPAAVVGFGSGIAQTKVGATMKELREMAYESGIIPLQRLFAEEIATQLLPLYEEDPRAWEVGYDLSKVRILQEDQLRLAERMDRLVRGRQITIGEARHQLGYETDESHNVWLQLFSYQVVNASQTVDEAVDTSVIPGAGAQEGEAGTELSRKAEGLKGAVPAAILQAFAVALVRDIDLLSGPFSRELAKRFIEFGARAAEIFLELTESGEIPDVLAGGPEVEEALARLIGGRLKAPGDPPEIEMAVNEIMARLDQEFDKPAILGYQEQYLKVAAATIDTAETFLGIVVNVKDPIEAAVFDTAGKRMGLVDLSGQTRNDLFKIIKESRDLGEGASQLAIRIKDDIPAGPWADARTRGQVIARTETKYAQNVSTISTYQEVDGINAVQVIEAQLGPTDAYCESMDGRIVSFSDGQVLADEEHPNGTLSLAPYYGDSPPIESVETVAAFEARTEGEQE